MLKVLRNTDQEKQNLIKVLKYTQGICSKLPKKLIAKVFVNLKNFSFQADISIISLLQWQIYWVVNSKLLQ